jgi:hypothetical protein
MGAWPFAPKSRRVTIASSFSHLRDFIWRQSDWTPRLATAMRTVLAHPDANNPQALQREKSVIGSGA